MKKAKKSIYFRYEFTDEKGKMEGGDIFEYAALSEAEAMISEALKVMLSDGVAINITVGEDKPFFGFLKSVGLSQKEIDAEKVAKKAAPKAKSSAKKKATKKKASKK